MLMTRFRKYLAEFLGTMALTLVVIVTIVSAHPTLTPILAAATLGFFAYTIGGLSGSHINPVVTIGAWSLKKIVWLDAIVYIFFQFLGAFCAYLLSSVLVNDINTKLAVKVGESSHLIVGVGEGLGTLFFTFGIAAIIYKRVPETVSGIVATLSLLIGIYIASTVSNGVLNPAVAFGIGSFNITYVLGPIIGAIAGMQLYKFLVNE